MPTLKDVIINAEQQGVAVGHFNVADLIMLKAVFDAARATGAPVIIGTSEGERDFIHTDEAAALIRSLRENHNYPIFLNADHTRSLEKVKEAVLAGYDAVLFDASQLPLEENIARTREAVQLVKSLNSSVLVEGEIGYIGSGSTIFKELPPGVSIKPEDLTKPEDAQRFVRETGVDLLAPAVGNIHGMFANAPNPRLDINRIKEIKKALRQVQNKPVPLVLHGGSGIVPEDMKAAVKAGIAIVHVSTELRAAWKEVMAKGLGQPEEIAPYKIAAPAMEAVKKVVLEKLRLFNG